MYRLGHGIKAGLAQALGCLEIDQLLALNALVFSIVSAHVSSLMPLVTIHAGDGGILNTSLCPRHMYVECARDNVQSSDRGSPVHETLADRAYGDESARGDRTRHKVGHPARRLAGLATFQAEHLARLARLATGITPAQEKLREIAAQHQDGTFAIDDGQASFDPIPDGIPMD